MTDLLQYGSRLEEAGLRVVRGVLEDVARDGLPGEHHFYLTIDTESEGVELPERLRQSYPGEMTVVLQHQFEDLQADAEGFSVTLSFSSVPYRMRVPWQALRRFVDPAANFGLEFQKAEADAGEETLGPRRLDARTEDGDEIGSSQSDADETSGTVDYIQPVASSAEVEQDEQAPDTSTDASGVDAGGVVRLDDFRNR